MKKKYLTFVNEQYFSSIFFPLPAYQMFIWIQYLTYIFLYLFQVMKPLLERKRRARINKCLDNLKDLMVTALQSEGESITKLEKADVLELTVKHLQKLKRQNALGLTPQATYAGRFKSGYAHCAQEVSKYMTGRPDVSVEVRTRLFSHLSNCMQALESMPPSVLSMAVPTQQGK